ncbi:hypothetical protein TSTA_060290 [Talaromyces stipitatus ATCC 10500]|uniref:Uncharacterized protein n=1 Tax=Talaromyces stipitatus (strain ATCC 10500 / CBS 375.48 / QM 6759 / NRRL 1006) TaxID=441959 RepID=B8LU61_TALSN|nr:uncharacterized protein TSTA_060290 [Talaromyces stipitatus ATCC 10500]XP_002339921.1 uncharacterized protein TSTA_060290 [Talaromyces stipitatus ATCC 10500]EED22533.1 hypothetical protein TSTA_060290 [Talaromyces stipitatus ATCC 10500]EED22534.1 hypothetical protein TSTA_060290 [Talaromyces stipitatus ATCC 10500]
MVKDGKSYLILNKHRRNHVLTSFGPGVTYACENLDWSQSQLLQFDGFVPQPTTATPTSFTGSGKPIPAPAQKAACQWTLGAKRHEGFRHIKASNGDYLYMDTGNALKTSSVDHDDRGLWKFIHLPSLKELTADDPLEKLDGKSASEWRDIANYIFQEGLNFIGGTPLSSLSNPALRQSWVDTWKKMGRTRDVYPDPKSSF